MAERMRQCREVSPGLSEVLVGPASLDNVGLLHHLPLACIFAATGMDTHIRRWYRNMQRNRFVETPVPAARGGVFHGNRPPLLSVFHRFNFLHDI